MDALDGDAKVKWTEGGVDARNYRVGFDKIHGALGWKPKHTVPGSIASLIAAVRAGMFWDVEAREHFYGNHGFAAPLEPGEGQGGGDAG